MRDREEKFMGWFLVAALVALFIVMVVCAVILPAMEGKL